MEFCVINGRETLARAESGVVRYGVVTSSGGVRTIIQNLFMFISGVCFRLAVGIHPLNVGLTQDW